MLTLYKKLVLPWRRRAEEAEAMCETLSQLVAKLSNEVCKK